MPDTSGAPASGGGLTGTLKSKFGPMPVWVWLALITAVLLGYWLLTKNKAGASSGSSGTPADVGQPGVVVINQDEPGTEPDTDDTTTGKGKKPKPKPKPPSSHPPKEPGQRLITVGRDETLAELARQRHWSADTLRDVEQENQTPGDRDIGPKTRLRKGQKIIRPPIPK